MPIQAPIQYVRDYYESVRRKNELYPQVAAFWLRALGHVDGDAVLNVGCGPMFFDNMNHFARPPLRYVGLDISASSLELLRHHDDPRLLQMKARAEAAGTEIELVCGDVFDCAPLLAGQFDSVLGLGFFGTFCGEELERLLALMRRILKPNGQLLKITWHGSHTTPEAARDKLRFGYFGADEPSPAELVTAFSRAGFELRSQSILDCDARAVGWEAIQVCLFERSG